MEGLVAESAARFSGRRVLVTGAAGFIGGRLASVLAAADADVSVLEAPAADLARLRSLLPHIQFYPVDVRSRPAVRDAISASQPEYVFQLAAVGVTEPFLLLELALSVNLWGAINVFRACFDREDGSHPPLRLVHSGTPYEYGGEQSDEAYPISPYAASKAAAFAVARMFHRTNGWPIVTVRPFQVYGPGQPEQALIPAAILAARAGQRFPMTGGEQRRDFVYVDDIVRGFLLAASRGVDGRSYDLGWGETRSLASVVNQLNTLLSIPIEPAFGALPYRPGEIWELQADTTRASQDLGWRPKVALEEGLALTVESLRARSSKPAS